MVSRSKSQRTSDEILYHVIAFLAILIYFYGQKLDNNSIRREFKIKPGLRLLIWSPPWNGTKLPIHVHNVQDKDLSAWLIPKCDSIVVVIEDVSTQLFIRTTNNQIMVNEWINSNIAKLGGDPNRIEYLR